MFKIFLLLYADDIVIFANTAEELQNSLDLLVCYCQRWKLTVNASKLKYLYLGKELFFFFTEKFEFSI